MIFLKLSRVFAAIAIAIPAIASAAVINVNQTIDLTTVDLTGSAIQGHYGAPVSLAVGDTLNLSVDFAGNQTLKMFDASNIFGWLMASDSNCTMFQASGTLTFTNGKGPVRPAGTTQTSGCAHFGLTFGASDFTSAPGPIEFSGMNFSTTVDSYSNGVSRDYSGPWLMMFASRFEMGTEAAADVPEPASFGLLALGVAALAASRRRKHLVK